MSYIPPSPTPTTQPQSSSNRTLWIILGSIGLVGVCSLLCIGVGVIGMLSMLGHRTSAVFSQIQSDLDAESSLELPAPSPMDVSAAIRPGTAQRVGDLEITVTDARIINGENGVAPEEYYQFLAVDLRIQNAGAQSVALDDLWLWSWLQDSDDFTYECCVFLLSDMDVIDAELDAGTEVEATIVYEVSEDAETLFWIYEGSPDNDPMIVRLNHPSTRTDVAGGERIVRLVRSIAKVRFDS